MSMLSGMTDKLRERAKVLRQGHWSDGHDDALLMEDAADTIDRLRCLYFDLDRSFGRLRDENSRLIDGNLRLQDLVQTMYGYYVTGTVEDCELCDRQGDCENHPATSCKYDEYDVGPSGDYFEECMRELGIEADE